VPIDWRTQIKGFSKTMSENRLFNKVS